MLGRRALGVVVIVVIIIITGWSLWRVFAKFSIGVEPYLWDELGKSYDKSYNANTNSWSFNMSPNSEADLIISVWNNGTVSLRNVSIKIEQISDGLTLNMYDTRPAQPSDIIWYLGNLPRGDGMTRGWPIFSPPQLGNYEITFRIAADKVYSNRFTVIIVVS